MDGPYGIDPRTQKPYLATYVPRHGVQPPAGKMTAVAPAIGVTRLLAGDVHRGGVKGMKPVGCEVTLQGGVNSVFVDCCGMCGKGGSRRRELRDCRWTPPCWLHPKLTNHLPGFAEKKCIVNRMQWRGPNARGAAATRQWAQCTAEIAWRRGMNRASARTWRRSSARTWQRSNVTGPGRCMKMGRFIHNLKVPYPDT